MSHENEYPDSLIKCLELIWGDGYMAPGGPGNVANLLDSIDTHGKRILDIGCGLGGPAFEMARTHGAEVVGIDLEAPLIARAQRAAKVHGLENRCSFQTVEIGPLPFDDGSFDVVVSSGAFTQVADKIGVLGESLRVLRPGGELRCYDWLKNAGDYSDDMQYWFELEGITYGLETLEEYAQHIRDAGFEQVSARDATDWYRVEARREYALMQGDLYPRMVELLGQADADYRVENWRVLVLVIDQGEMRQGYLRGTRPAFG
ncbi:MAG: methyltransferase domain-containing protein [Proteobacteria bacterium]|nr:methyltransferase domain-containing protein [Pseudomonadota bacterium]MDA1062876.1 methyltransferase domain-containing protein [Pseudomonadota bacterium]